MDLRDREYFRKRAEIERQTLSDDPNITYDDRIVKYTINLPASLYIRIAKECIDIGKVEKRKVNKSEWIRKKLEDALEGKPAISFKNLVSLLEQEKQRQNRASLQQEFDFAKSSVLAWFRRGFSRKKRPHNIDPPRRYHGFIEGLQDPKRYVTWKQKKEKILDNSL